VCIPKSLDSFLSQVLLRHLLLSSVLVDSVEAEQTEVSSGESGTGRYVLIISRISSSIKSIKGNLVMRMPLLICKSFQMIQALTTEAVKKCV
jgi:hypothetical protein